MKRLWVPQGFDPRDALPRRLWKDCDAARVLLDWIVARAHLWNGGQVRIHRDTGIAMMGRRRWDRVRPALEEAGIIRCDHVYSYKIPDHERAMAYSLNPQWFSRGEQQVELRDPRLIANLAAIETQSRALWVPIHYHMTDVFRLIAIDRDAALRRARRIRNPKRRQYAVNAIERIASGDLRLRPSETTGRVFSSLTRLPRILRPYLRLNGQRLTGYDVSACQPLLLGLLAAGSCTHSEIPRANQEQAGSNRSNNTNTWRAFAPMDGCIPADVLRHLHACEQGSYYVDFAEAICKPGSAPLPLRRAKRGWLKFAFGRHRPEGAWFKRFSAGYPTVAEFLANLKTSASAAAILQTAEANVMIHGVCEQLRLRYPAIPFFSIHDSILTTSDHLETVVQVNAETWENIRAKPRIKIVAC